MIEAEENEIYEKLRRITVNKASLTLYSYPILKTQTLVNNEEKKPPLSSSSSSSTTIKTCRRCASKFNPSKYYATYPNVTSRCRYHNAKSDIINGRKVHGCCQAPIKDFYGCTIFNWHVFEDFKNGDPSPFCDELQFSASDDGNFKAVALDAEMFYTVSGFEVCRVTLVDFFTENTLLDILIHPRSTPILDYNTNWSGISADSYTDGKFEVKSFEDPKLKMGEIIGRSTILIGHSIDNDLHVLEFSHELIVDTAILYPHKNRPPNRMSLKALALNHLSLTVQQSKSGHVSKEDCLTCIKLVKKYLNSK